MTSLMQALAPQGPARTPQEYLEANGRERDGKAHRSWIGTNFDNNARFIAHLQQIEGANLITNGLEIAPSTGNKHNQFAVTMAKPIRFGAFRSLMNSGGFDCHVEPARNGADCHNYCRKDSTQGYVQIIDHRIMPESDLVQQMRAQRDWYHYGNTDQDAYDSYEAHVRERSRVGPNFDVFQEFEDRGMPFTQFAELTRDIRLQYRLHNLMNNRTNDTDTFL